MIRQAHRSSRQGRLRLQQPASPVTRTCPRLLPPLHALSGDIACASPQKESVLGTLPLAGNVRCWRGLSKRTPSFCPQPLRSSYLWFFKD